MDDNDGSRKPNAEPISTEVKREQLDAWMRLRGALKDIYAEYGGGEAYLLKERAEFNRAMETRERRFENASCKSGSGSNPTNLKG